MDGSNLDITRRLIEAINDRSLERLIRLCDAEVAISTVNTRLLGLELNGHAGLARWLSYLERCWASLYGRGFELEADREWVLGEGRMHGRGKASPSEIDYDVYLAVRVRLGLVDRIGFYLTRDDARRAAETGLVSIEAAGESGEGHGAGGERGLHANETGGATRD